MPIHNETIDLLSRELFHLSEAAKKPIQKEAINYKKS